MMGSTGIATAVRILRDTYGTDLAGELRQNVLPELYYLVYQMGVREGDIFFLWYQDRMTYQDIGERFHIPASQVRSTIQSIQRRLRHPDLFRVLEAGMEFHDEPPTEQELEELRDREQALRAERDRLQAEIEADKQKLAAKETDSARIWLDSFHLNMTRTLRLQEENLSQTGSGQRGMCREPSSWQVVLEDAGLAGDLVRRLDAAGFHTVGDIVRAGRTRLRSRTNLGWAEYRVLADTLANRFGLPKDEWTVPAAAERLWEQKKLSGEAVRRWQEQVPIQGDALPLTLTLGQMGLSNRAANTLRGAKIRTAQDLVDAGPAEVFRVRSMGPLTYVEVAVHMVRKFGQDPELWMPERAITN